jgi:hypothetical protein
MLRYKYKFLFKIFQHFTMSFPMTGAYALTHGVMVNHTMTIIRHLPYVTIDLR